MAKQDINIGSAPNAGDGDPIRTAFSKAADNFNEIYSSYEMTGKLSVGNATVNTTVSNTSGVRTGNSTYVTTVNSIAVQVSNSAGLATLTATALTIGSNVTVGIQQITTGTSTVNSSSNSTLVRVANSSSSANLNAGGLTVGSSVINTTAIAAGANVVINTSSISIGNSLVNVVITSAGFSGNVSLDNLVITGNLTVNGTVTTVNTATLDVADLNITIAKNATTEALANGAGLTIAGANATIQYIESTNTINFSHSIAVGNDSVYTTVNGTSFSGTANDSIYAFGKSEGDLNVNNAVTANDSSYLGGTDAANYVQNNDSRELSGNLYFTGTNNVFSSNLVKIGTSSITANGYSYLPNGLLMNWGIVSANSSDGNVTFASAFSTVVYTVTVSGTNTEITTIPVVIAANTTEALIRTSNASSVNVYFTAIGW